MTGRTYRVRRSFADPSPVGDIDSDRVVSSLDNASAADEKWLNDKAAVGFRLIRAEAEAGVMIYVMERVDDSPAA